VYAVDVDSVSGRLSPASLPVAAQVAIVHRHELSAGELGAASVQRRQVLGVDELVLVVAYQVPGVPAEEATTRCRDVAEHPVQACHRREVRESATKAAKSISFKFARRRNCQGLCSPWIFQVARRIMSSKGIATGSRVTLHVVSSLDGFIARKDNSVSWLEANGSVYEDGVSVSEEEAATFVKAIDCYVLGSRTYEHALELGWPYGDTPTVVVTGRQWPPAKESVEFYSGDLETLVHGKLAPRFRNIWLVGGAILCQRFLELGLVDEIKLTIAPVLLGDGLRLFGGFLAEERWDLKNVVAYKNGFVELSYVGSAV